MGHPLIRGTMRFFDRRVYEGGVTGAFRNCDRNV
jgi:hypothetical protein